MFAAPRGSARSQGGIVRFIGTSVQAPADSHTAPITSLEWSPDGQFLASGSYDGSVLIWERNGWRAKHRLFHPRLRAMIKHYCDLGTAISASLCGGLAGRLLRQGPFMCRAI